MTFLEGLKTGAVTLSPADKLHFNAVEDDGRNKLAWSVDHINDGMAHCRSCTQVGRFYAIGVYERLVAVDRLTAIVKPG